MNQAAEIAVYLNQNPSLKVGIDGSSPRGSDSRAVDLAGLRVISVRNALINAGVPTSRIEVGSFGDPQLIREGRVEVLIRTR